MTVKTTGPGDIKPNKVKIKMTVSDNGDTENKDNTENCQEDPKSIWCLSEVPEVPVSDDASYDPRQRPDYDIKFRQAVGSEDIFLGLGRKTPATASCETMVLTMDLKGEKKVDIDLHITKQHLDLRSPLYRLSLPLPHPINPDKSSAEWIDAKSVLTVHLTLDREYDFANF